MHKTLIFHIGDHKTGSTSIQLAFAENRVQLAQKRIFYPAALALNILRRQFQTWLDAGSDAQKAEAAQPLAALAERIRASDADFVLVSAESLETLPPEDIKQVLDHFFADCADEIRIIAYVRPHAARLLSSFSERIKLGAPRVMQHSLTEFARDIAQTGALHYTPRFQSWHSLYGAQFTLRPMIRSQLYAGSVVEDFIQQAFPDVAYQLHPGQIANESLDLLDLMRLKVLQRGLQHCTQGLRHKVGWEFARQVGQRPARAQQQKLQLHKALAKEIRATYLEDARALDRAFFNGTPLMEQALYQAVRQARYRAHSVEPDAYLTASERDGLTLLASFIAGMLDNDSVDWPRFFHQKRLQDVQTNRRPDPAA